MSDETEPKPGTEEETPNEETQNEDEKPPEEGEGEEKPGETEGEGEKPESEEAGGEDSGEPPEADEKRKRAGGWQRRIERLERQNEQKDQLIQRLSTQGPQPNGIGAQPGKEKTPEEKTAEYINNLVVEQLTKREQQRQAQTAQAEFQRRTAEVRARKPDFEDVVMSVSDIPVSQAVTEALLTSEQGPDIMYELAKNPGELARISALRPLDAAREIGRLEARLASSTATPKTTTKPALRPPVPPTSVNGSAASTRDLDDMPLAQYKLAMRSRRR